MKFVFSDLEFIELLAKNKPNYQAVFTRRSPYDYLHDILNDLLLNPGIPFVYEITVENTVDKVKINVGKICRYLWRQLTAAEKHLLTSMLIESEHGSKILKKLTQHLPDIHFYRAEIEMEFKVLKLLRLRSAVDEPDRIERLGTGAVVSKVITFSLEDELDPEVIDAVYLTVKQSGARSCVIRCSQQAIHEEFYLDSMASTLVSVGHGFLRKPGSIGYRCGPFTGTHDDVVHRVSEMLAQLSSLKEFVLTHCYYGATPRQLPRGLEVSYTRAVDSCASGQVTASVVWDPEATARIPFKRSSFAAMLWSRLRSLGLLDRGFAITATPQILNPYPYSCPTHFIAADKDTYHSGCTHQFWQEETGCRLSRATTVTLVARPALLLYALAAPSGDIDLALSTTVVEATADTVVPATRLPGLTS